jgi:hypothetical protein
MTNFHRGQTDQIIMHRVERGIVGKPVGGSARASTRVSGIELFTRTGFYLWKHSFSSPATMNQSFEQATRSGKLLASRTGRRGPLGAALWVTRAEKASDSARPRRGCFPAGGDATGP